MQKINIKATDSPLGASNKLSDAGHEDVHSRHSLVVVVHLHVEGLDALGIVDHNRGALVHLLCDIALVFRAQVVAPAGVHQELHLLLADVGLQQLHGLGVGDLREIVLDDVEQTVLEALLAHRILVLEVVQVVRAVLQGVSGAELHVVLLHIVAKKETMSKKLKADKGTIISKA